MIDRRRGRRSAIAIAVLVVVIYGIRAAIGLVGGLAYAQGADLAAQGYYTRAIPLLDRGAVGENRFEARWLAAEVRLGLWMLMAESQDPGEEGLEMLRRSASGYLQSARLSPAAGWPWASLGTLYDRLENYYEGSREYELGAIPRGRWALVGDAGRIAIGMLRAAIEREPQSHLYRDWLVIALLERGLVQEAEDEVRRAAAVQPRFDVHTHLLLANPPESILRAFAEASREAVGKAPLLSEERHLFSLGRLYQRLGELDQAEAFLKRAIEFPTMRLRDAEASYHLAHVLAGAGRFQEARDALEVAEQEDAFLAGALELRARMALEEGDLTEARRFLQRARVLEPRNLRLCMSYASLARQTEPPDWGRALEALRWAIIVHPRNQLPRIELVSTLLSKGDLVEAASQLERAYLALGPTPKLDELAADIHARGGPLVTPEE